MLGVAVVLVLGGLALFVLSEGEAPFPSRAIPIPGTPITMRVQSAATAREAAVFRRGLVLEYRFLERMGRPLGADVEARLAHGDPCVPSAEPGAGATGWADHGWLCVDALVPIWRENVQNEPVVASGVSAHELVHVWQEELGCGSDDQYLWLTEGMATDFAWRALVAAGLTTERATGEAIRRFGAFNERVGPLQSYEDRTGADPEYALWHLAVRDLLRGSRSGPAAMRSFCEFVGNGTGWRDAFARAFGRSVDQFYRAFAAARPAYRAGRARL